MIQDQRIQLLNDKPISDGRYVLYWMQAAQRARYNHALAYAARQANDLGLPLVCVFGLSEEFPDANERHYAFMLQGLAETEQALQRINVQLVVRHQRPDEAVIELGRDAALVIADRGYLRVQLKWRQSAAARLSCQLVQVDTDVIVPVEVVSDKEEYAARTIRTKILRLLPKYLQPLRQPRVKRTSLDMELSGLDVSDLNAVLGMLPISRDVSPVREFAGGASRAQALLNDFIGNKLNRYAELSNNPALDYTSHMSPYLHFGQISPLDIALQVIKSGSAGVDAYLEQLIVRRELSINFVRFNSAYDEYAAIPEWAQRSLGKHADDARDYVYSLEQLEQVDTHDLYWNMAQLEMVLTGKMHSYMRMYWAKKLLEWSACPQDAFEAALHLNNKYELDGRDPNSFAGVAWCFGKHDRPWKERAVFGQVRYMSAAGLERKFNIGEYVKRISNRLN